MNKRIAVLMVTVSFMCSVLLYSAEEKKLLVEPVIIEQEEKKEAEAESAAQAIPEAPPIQQAEEALVQAQRENQQRDKQFQQERVDGKASQDFVSSIIANAVQQTDSQAGNDGQEEKKEAADKGIDPNTRSLLVFLDDSEINSKTSSSTTGQLIATLYQEAGPILTSGSLLSSIFTSDGMHRNTAEPLIADFNAIFDSRKWVARRVRSNLFLLIPKKYFKQDDQASIAIVETNPSPLLEPVEYSLGLKINHLEPLKNSDKNSLQSYFMLRYEQAKQIDQQHIEVEFVEQQFIDALAKNHLFVPITEYQDNSGTIPNWVIYLAGHGGYGDSIAGISLVADKKTNQSPFQKLLDYLSKKIKTKLLVYSSCYGAGYNAEQVFSELKKTVDVGIGGTRSYPFTIVTGATTDAPTYRGNIEFKVGGGIDSEIKYDEFIKEAQKESINYPVALGYLFPMIKRPIRALWNDEIGSMPQMRPVNSPAWFPITDINKAVIRIGNVMASTRKKPFLIKQYKGADGQMHDPKAILLATDTIKFPIVIDESVKKIPPFVSLLPGEVTHTLAELTYYGAPFSLKDFTADIAYGDTKKIIIKDLKALNKEDKKERWTNVVIDMNTSLRSAKLSGIYVKTGIKKYVFASKADEEAFNVQNEKFLELASSLQAVSGPFIGLSKTVDLNYKNSAGDNALHCAARVGNKAITNYLLFQLDIVKRQDDKIDINAKNNSGKTPLMIAAEHNWIELIKLLLKAGADKNIRNDSDGNKTAYDYLADANRAGLPELQSDLAANQEFFALASMPSLEIKEIMEFMTLSRIVDLNYKNEAGDNALHCAAKEKNEHAVYLLIDPNKEFDNRSDPVLKGKKIDLNAKNNSGMTPLMVAAQKESIKIIELLLKAGADKNILNSSDQDKTAYDYLTEENRKKLPQLQPDAVVAAQAVEAP
ncbi:MAG: ankyrin repeat domain-containing protein [Candidatus Dependentiae bacterium]|nr:ankyrin repeat domain-containing protein [Candidatus Dependentiae bacterium]